MLGEFKDFIAKGNVMDMAVGIIIGAAFTAIVNSLVADLINPIISLFMGGVDFGSKFINLTDDAYTTLAAAQEAGAATFNYGTFINAIIEFLIVAFVVFLLVKAVNKVKKKEEAAAPPKTEIVLLGEIRDALLKK